MFTLHFGPIAEQVALLVATFAFLRLLGMDPHRSTLLADQYPLIICRPFVEVVSRHWEQSPLFFG